MKLVAKIRFCGLVGIISLSAAISPVSAQVSIRVGTMLSPTERANLQAQPTINVGNQQVRILDMADIPNRAAGLTVSPTTLVVNEDGVVGQSENIVTISRLSTSQSQARAARWISQAVSVKYYEHMDLTVLRFATFSEAAAARAAIEKTIPEAGVALPVQYTTRRAN